MKQTRGQVPAPASRPPMTSLPPTARESVQATQPAPELAAAMAETRALRELVREICDELVSRKYPAARVAPWLKRAGLTP